jgi:SpoVK/Ycf46/Vps4 family AAA+-type ATPase
LLFARSSAPETTPEARLRRANASETAPAIIFVDDSDAIVESGEELGLYRYLLTMLDGLESESAGQVCVMGHGEAEPKK